MRIHLVEAKFERDTEMFGKMDPYVKMAYREQEWKSKVVDGGGKHPVWKDQFWDVDVKYLGDDITFKFYDEDIGKDDHIADGMTKTSALCTNGGIDEWFSLTYKGKDAGKVHFRCEWTSN